MARLTEKERLLEVRRLNNRLAEINGQLGHLENFIQYAHDSAELQEELTKLHSRKDRERLQTHKELVKLATKPKGYQTAGMLIQSRRERNNHEK